MLSFEHCKKRRVYKRVVDDETNLSEIEQDQFFFEYAPETEQYREEGREAFLAGKSEGDNPYDDGKDFDKHCSWHWGWYRAFEDANAGKSFYSMAMDDNGINPSQKPAGMREVDFYEDAIYPHEDRYL